MISRRIVEYCSEEVGRQYANRSGLDACRAVPGMVRAWISAKQDSRITVVNILRWAKLIEPDKNKDYEFRQIRVRVGDYLPPSPEGVPSLMDQFVANIKDMTAEEAYFEFQRIHPFVDGNGRCGKIIFNIKNQTMHQPIWPPNKWDILNP